MNTIYNIRNNPFAKYSAEEELEALGEIFYQQRYYPALIELSIQGVSRFILGQRGQGKSATIYHLQDDLRTNNILPVLITRYDDFPLKENENYFLYSMIQGITFELAKHLYERPQDRKKLSASLRSELAFLIEAFYEPHCGDEFIEFSEEAKKKRRCNFFRKWWNRLGVKMANGSIGVVTKVSAQLIQSWAGVSVDFSSFDTEYFSELEIQKVNQLSKSDITNIPTEKLIKMLKSLNSTAQTLGYQSVVILFDKVDEIKGISANVNSVADFILDLVSDTDLLYTDKLSIVISLWSEAKNALNKKGVRFDKFKVIDIRWRPEELIQLINKRLLYYTEDKSIPITFETLVTDETLREELIRVSDCSPRALITLFSYIFNEETQTSPIIKFSQSAITKGLMAFCKNFDYISLQPSRTGKSGDLINWINRILRMKLICFSTRQYAEYIGSTKNSATVRSHISTLLKYNIVKDSLYPTEDGDIIYQVVDPRIEYLIKRGEVDLNR